MSSCFSDDSDSLFDVNNSADNTSDNDNYYIV